MHVQTYLLEPLLISWAYMFICVLELPCHLIGINTWIQWSVYTCILVYLALFHLCVSLTTDTHQLLLPFDHAYGHICIYICKYIMSLILHAFYHLYGMPILQFYHIYARICIIVPLVYLCSYICIHKQTPLLLSPLVLNHVFAHHKGHTMYTSISKLTWSV